MQHNDVLSPSYVFSEQFVLFKKRHLLNIRLEIVDSNRIVIRQISNPSVITSVRLCYVYGCRRLKAHKVIGSDQASTDEIGLCRQLCVFINPQSGAGKAVTLFQEKIQPIFKETGVQCKIFVTERCNHAYEMVQNIDLKLYDGIVIVSGDGLLFEVFNGLMARSDRSEALKVPLTMIPAGSGNAALSSILYSCGYSLPSDMTVSAALVAVRPKYTQMRLWHIETTRRHLCAFLSLGYGIMADIDIESEKFRKSLGSSRFVLGALLRVARLRTYFAKVSYLPAVVSGEVGALWHKYSKQNYKNKKHRTGFQPSALLSKSTNEVLRSDEEATELQATSNANGEVLSGCRSSQVELDAETSLKISNLNVQMPALDEPVPKDWVQREEEWLSIYAVSLSHISAEGPFMPHCQWQGDVLWLTLVKAAGVSRSEILRWLIACNNGQHLSHRCCEVIPVRAIRIEPHSAQGCLTVDGEMLSEGGPVQMCASQFSAAVMKPHCNAAEFYADSPSAI